MAVQLNRLPSHVRSLAEPQVLQQVDIIDITRYLDIYLMFCRARMLQSLFLSHTRILSTRSHVLARVSTCADIVDIVDIYYYTRYLLTRASTCEQWI